MDELIKEMHLLSKEEPYKISKKIEEIKSNFYNKLNLKKKEEASKETGDSITNKLDPIESKFKKVYNIYRKIKSDIRKRKKQEEEKNLKLKKQIIKDIGALSKEEESINLANSTEYGLSATLFTGSMEKAKTLGSALRAGTVWVNCFLVRDLSAPFGGLGISGLGREGGDYALDFHSDLKTLQIRNSDDS